MLPSGKGPPARAEALSGGFLYVRGQRTKVRPAQDPAPVPFHIRVFLRKPYKFPVKPRQKYEVSQDKRMSK